VLGQAMGAHIYYYIVQRFACAGYDEMETGSGADG
jgi:hypothetical protein